MQFVVGLGDKVSPTDIEEGMRVGYFLTQSTKCSIFRCSITQTLHGGLQCYAVVLRSAISYLLE